jgi:hypothetical protein
MLPPSSVLKAASKVCSYLQTTRHHIPEMSLSNQRTRLVLQIYTLFWKFVFLNTRTEPRSHYKRNRTYDRHCSLSAMSGIATIHLLHHQFRELDDGSLESARADTDTRCASDVVWIVIWMFDYVVIFIAGPYCLKVGERMGIFLIAQLGEGWGEGPVDWRGARR